MLEVGWSEILVIALILIIVVGPKDLPGMLRNFGRMASRVRSMANEFKGQFDEALREAELDDVRKGLNEVNKLNPANTLRDAINPIRQLGQDIKSDLQKASDSVNASVAATTKADETLAAVSEEPAASAEASPVEEVVGAATATVALPSTAQPVVAPQPVSSPVAEAAKPVAKKAKVHAKAADAEPAMPAVKKASPRKKAVDAEPAAAVEAIATKKAAPRKKSVKADKA